MSVREQELEQVIDCLARTMELLLSTAQRFERQASQGSGGRRGGPVFTKARAAIAKATEVRKQPMSVSTMTLGKIISAVEQFNDGAEFMFDFGDFQPTSINSYRGYYNELALGYDGDTQASWGISKPDFLKMLNSAIGRTFQGYKGGDYVMDTDTPVWVANWGHANETAIIGIGKIDKTTGIIMTSNANIDRVIGGEEQ